MREELSIIYVYAQLNNNRVRPHEYEKKRRDTGQRQLRDGSNENYFGA